MKMETIKLLTDLVDYEKNITDILVQKINVSFNNSNSSVIITDNKDSYIAQLNKNIIHQICSRIWQNINRFTALDKWENIINSNPDYLKQLIKIAIEKNPTILRVLKNGNNNIIYGIVGQSYIPVNQIEYRNELLILMKNYNILHISKFIINKRSVSEIFQMNEINSKIRLNLLVNYPINDGYHGFHSSWIREIIICTNGLSEIQSKISFHQKHDSQLNIEQYLKNIFFEGQNIYKNTDENIIKAKETKLDNKLFAEFMQRLHVATASKERLLNRLKTEIMDTNNTEWSLSQALTWIGTHERHMHNRPKFILKEAGTKILDLTLQKYLEDENNVATENLYEGYSYKALLPKFLSKN